MNSQLEISNPMKNESHRNQMSMDRRKPNQMKPLRTSGKKII